MQNNKLLFGCNLEKETKKPLWLKQASARIISHMNEEHCNSIVSALHAQHGIQDKNAQMAELSVNGFYASSQNKLYFLTFERSCSSSEEYKLELIKHAKKYRDYEIAT